MIIRGFEGTRLLSRVASVVGVGGVVVATLVAVTVPASAAPSVVRVAGTQGNWRLTIDGAAYQVKGLTFGPAAADAGRYLPDVRAMGVNTVRTWGTDGSTQPLLTAAQANGIKVINGFWLGHGNNYLSDATYKTNTLNEIRNWVNTYKNDPAVLMWDVGNEVLLNLQNYYSGATLEQQRNAYAQFVDDVAAAIHAVDPNHPVTSTDAWTGALPYYKANSPNLDLYAVNSYGDVCGVRQAWINGGYSKPYIITESGPRGEWEVPNDANGVPDEPTDIQKRDGYTSAWNCIKGHTGVALGATLFHYGIENDFGGVWYNLLPGGLRRLSYHSVVQAYGGTSPGNRPPVISAMSIDNSGAVPAGKSFTVRAAATDPDGDPLTYRVRFCSKYLDQSTGFTDASFTQSGPGQFTVTAPTRLGVWKVYVFAEDGRGNVGIETRSFRVVPPPVNGTNLARGKPTTASSYQAVGDGAPYSPNLATDGNFGTRWASDWSDPQWIQVDLGQRTTFGHVQLAWEGAYARSYQIQVSDDASNWQTIHATTTGQGGVEDFDLAGTGRYVRVNGTQRGTGFGYSLYEFGIYTGTSSGGRLDRAGWTATASSNSAEAGNAIDADPGSRWTSAAAMSPGMWLTVDMHATHQVQEVSLDSGGHAGDYPRGYEVYLSSDGSSWGSPVAAGTGSGPLVKATFTARSARFIRVVQTGSASSWWSVVDLFASGS